MDSSGNATFSGNLDVGGSITKTGNLTVDVSGEIILDSDAEFVRIYHDGGWIGGFQLTNNDFIIRSAVTDKDLIFKGNDGGSTITALTLDMSAAGAATFNSDIYVPTKIVHTGDTDTYLEFSASNTWRVVAGDEERFKVASGEVTVNESSQDTDFRVESNNNANMLFIDAGNDRVAVGHNAPTETLHVAGAVRISNNSADTYFGYGSNSDNYISTGSGGATIFRQLGTERGRLDSSGNFLIGKDAVNTFNEGFVAKAAGGANITAAGATVLELNRRSSDGKILELRKDNTSVGMVGTANSGDLYLGNNDTGLMFAGGSAAIIPYNPSGNTFRDGAIKLGLSTHRFRSLNLSAEDPSSSDTSQIRFLTTAGSSLADAAITTSNDSGGTDLLLGSNVRWNSGSLTRFTTGRSGSAIRLGYTGTMRFYTESGTSMPTERMRIDGDGKVTINRGSSGYTPTSRIVKTYLALNTDYDAGGTQGVYFSHLDGNWIDGDSGADSQYGMLFGYQQSVRGGLIYDHRGSEMMSMWSTYGPIRFMTADSVDGNGVPIDSNIKSRFYIATGGNIGIGPDFTSPSTPLQINHTLPQIRLEETGSGGSKRLDLSVNSSGIAIIGANQSAQEMRLMTTGSNRLVVKSNGRIAIGEDFTTPSYALELKEGVSNDFISRFYNTNTNGMGLLVRTDATAANNQVAFGVYTNSAYLIQARSNGRVGIKNTAPSEVLTVGGVIAASESSYTVNATTANFGFYNGGTTPTTYVQMPASGSFQLWKPNTGAYFNADSGGRIGIQKGPVSTVSLSIAAQATSTSSYGLEITNATSNTRFLVDGVGNSWFYKTDNVVGMKFNAAPSSLAPLLDITNTSNSTASSCGLSVQGGGNSGSTGYQFRTKDYSGNVDFFIRGDGNVGIGTTSPANQLVLKSGTNVDMEFGSETGGTFIQSYNRSSSAYGYLRFITNGETMRLTNSGLVGIGTTSPSSLLHVQLNTSTTNTTVDLLRLTTLSTGTTTTGFGPEIRFQAERNDGVMQNTGAIASKAEVNSGSNISSGLAFETGTAGVLSEKMRLKYNGYLGVGTTDPQYPIHVKFGGRNGITIGSTDASGAYLVLDGDGNGDGAGGDYSYIEHNSSGNLTFNVGNASNSTTQRAQISADGHLSVGTTGTGFTNNGHVLRGGNSYAAFVRTSGVPVVVNRHTSNGDLIEFMYDASTIGSIGSEGGDSLYIQSAGSSGVGLRFHPTTTNIEPLRNGARVDAVVDLGTAANRFKTLSLSGGVYVGNGSASAPTMTFDSDTDTGFYRYSSGKISMTGNGTESMRMSSFGLDMTMNSNAYVDLNRSGFITFYGTGSNQHGIGSRDASGTATDDIRINSFGAVHINLDANNDDTNETHSRFTIGRHGAGAGTIDLLMTVSGENGNLLTEGNVTAYGSTSDIRLKENIEVIPNALEKVQKLRGITFNYKKDGSRSTGLIAQELEEVLPEVVYTETELDGENPHLAVRYGNTVGLLVEAIKEQQQQIETLKQTIEEMKDGSNKDEQD